MHGFMPTGKPLSVAQAEILASGLLSTGFNCLLEMPTGSGKTWLAEQAIADALERGARAVYLTPLRAQATEKAMQWRSLFAPVPVGVFTGDYGGPGNPYPVTFQDARVLIMTPERLDACTRLWRTPSHWSWIPEVEIVVVDEFHLLGDRDRGARLEGALSRIRRLNPFLTLVGLSATLGNLHEIADWLEGVEYRSSLRPVPLRWRTVRYRKAGEKPKLLVREVTRTVAAGGKCLVFMQSRRRSEEIGRHLQECNLRAAHHHAGLRYEERHAIEEAFRGTALDILVATATLELGVNLPARQVILYDLQTFDGVDFQSLPTMSVWQRAGRAGRPGLDTEGEVVLFASVWDRQAKHYEAGKFEPIRSGLADPRALAEQVIVEVSSGFAKTHLQLERIFAHSLAAHQGRLPSVRAAVIEMCNAGMLREIATVERESGLRSGSLKLEATRLGHIAVRHHLSPATITLFSRTLDQEKDLTFLDFLLLAASCEDCEPVLPVGFEELDALSSRLADEASSLIKKTQSDVCRLLGVKGKRLLSSVKMALVARAWTRSDDSARVAESYGCYPFEVERLCASLERIFLAMAALSEHKGKAGCPDAEVSATERVQALQRMIAMGLDESAATLTLVEGIGPKTARRLLALGLCDIEDLALSEPTSVSQQLPGVSPQRASRWVETAIERVSTASAFRYREDSRGGYPASPERWPWNVDPYRLRRALDLKVTERDGGAYLITGGLDPHLISPDEYGFVCDCPDARKGSECKHQLAVRLRCGDQTLLDLVRQLSPSPRTSFNLFKLWFDGRNPSPEP